jgi:hypothetical protein
MLLAATPSNTELLQRALSHVQFPGESYSDTLARIAIAPQHVVSTEQLLMEGVENEDVTTIAVKAGLGPSGGQIDLSQFAASVQPTPGPIRPPPVSSNRQPGTELTMELDSVATADLYSDDEWESTLAPTAAVRSERQINLMNDGTHLSDDWGFVTAAACVEGNLLGAGTGCEGVYRLTSPNTGVSYAVKKICRPRPGTPAETNLHRELQILHGLRHPSVSHLHAHVQDGMYHFLVLTLCEDGDLFELVANGSVTGDAEVRAYFARITEAVQYLHDNRVYHRDLKLENVLVRNAATREIEVNDFGHSRCCSLSSAVESRGYGTHAYMAPEMFDDPDSGNYDPAAVDVWSLGVMLYVMIAVRYPFGYDSGPGCQTTSEVRRRICNRAPKPNSDFQFTPADRFASKDLRELLCGMLAVDAGQRMTLAQVRASNWVRAALPRQDQVALYPERPPLEFEAVNPDLDSQFESTRAAESWLEDDGFDMGETCGEEAF